MSFQLRREEILSGEQLSAMLEESPARAAQAILLAAGEGEVEAQALLGQILLDGQGIAKDQALALRWFGIAAGRGHLMARNMLGRCHEHGWGVAADASVADVESLLVGAVGMWDENGQFMWNISLEYGRDEDGERTGIVLQIFLR